MSASAAIRRLRIERFRGIEKIDWWPTPGLNILVGGGDSGKTTVLEAIALLLNPTNSLTLSEADYWNCERNEGFMIGAVISLPPSTGPEDHSGLLWPWHWDGKQAVVPSLRENNSDLSQPVDPVYKIRASGNAELDLSYDIILPSGDTVSLSPSLRREIGLVRLGGDERNDRDLRLVRGSALDRLLSDKTLRARVGAAVTKDDLAYILDENATAQLETLNRKFGEQVLPTNLGLGLYISHGLSIGALTSLTAMPGSVRLPLTCWGAGTRRLASLAIARACGSGCPITIVDEAERGLEPYRQRALASELATSPSQVFMTTHSAAILNAAQPAKISHLSRTSNLWPLDGQHVSDLQKRDPEVFLSRLPIIAEGPTEVGFVAELLATRLKWELLDHGIKVVNGTGNDNCLALLQQLLSAEFRFGAFVDNEGRKPQLWSQIKDGMGDLLMRWSSGSTEQNVIGSVSEDRLVELISDPEGVLDQARLTTLAHRLKHMRGEGFVLKGHGIDDIVAEAGQDLRQLVVEAACGIVPEGVPEEAPKTWKKSEKHWFKSEAGGRELARKMFSLGAWPSLQDGLEVFVTAVATAAD